MCGRFTLTVSEFEIYEAFGLEGKSDFSDYLPRYNIAPGQEILSIIHDGTKKRLGPIKWGLVPSWSKDKKIGYKMINARSETAHEKPSFKRLMANKRCLIVADSFYEWKKTEAGKQPKRIYLENRPLFAFAGLWDKWEKDGEVLFTCTILTKEANSFMSDIHDRMPVILPEGKENEWINPNATDPIERAAFLQEIEISDLAAYNVSNTVNSVKNEEKACIEPLSS